jgi:hypothetical protein
MNLNADRIAPSPQPSPPMGAREKTSQVMRFMGSKREGFIWRILSPTLSSTAWKRGSWCKCQVAPLLTLQRARASIVLDVVGQLIGVIGLAGKMLREKFAGLVDAVDNAVGET